MTNCTLLAIEACFFFSLIGRNAQNPPTRGEQHLKDTDRVTTSELQNETKKTLHAHDLENHPKTKQSTKPITPTTKALNSQGFYSLNKKHPHASTLKTSSKKKKRKS